MTLNLTSFSLYAAIFTIYALKCFGITGSYSFGIILFILFNCVLFKSNVFNYNKFILSLVFVLLFIVVHSFIGVKISDVSFDYVRFLTHYIGFLFIVVFLYLTGSHGNRIIFALNNCLVLFFYSMPIILIVAKFNIMPMHLFDVNYSKPMFPFQEPSHYFNFLTLCSIVYFKNNGWVLPLLLYPISLYLYPSATGLFGFILLLCAIALNSRVKYGLLLFIIPCLLLIFILMFNLLGSYYTDRLFFWSTNNLSALVYLQGFESAMLGFIESYGVGVGLGQMSSIVKQTETAEIILSITNNIYFNVFSGSFPRAGSRSFSIDRQTS